jgi:formate dehydrogenase major subunit
MADIYAPIRAGSDIAFLGGLINYVVNHERWSTDPIFREDTEDLDGVFSGLMQYDEKSKDWPYNGFVGQYENTSWQYAATAVEHRGWAADTQKSGEQSVGDRDVAQRGAAAGQGTPPGSEQKPLPGPPFEPLVKALLKPPPQRDATLKHPGTVFQIVKRHFARYTPEMVEQTTGCPKETFLKVAETILANSGRDRTTSFAYAVAWTQHTKGPQVIGACALLQLLLGNVGRPGAGIMALRGHASIQGSTDVPTLYHSIHGYMAHPSAPCAPWRSTCWANGAWRAPPATLPSGSTVAPHLMTWGTPRPANAGRDPAKPGPTSRCAAPRPALVGGGAASGTRRGPRSSRSAAPARSWRSGRLPALCPGGQRTPP